jgi:hypothetical protein
MAAATNGRVVVITRHATAQRIRGSGTAPTGQPSSGRVSSRPVAAIDGTSRR